jgi:hypothetical protein
VTVLLILALDLWALSFAAQVEVKAWRRRTATAARETRSAATVVRSFTCEARPARRAEDE